MADSAGLVGDFTMADILREAAERSIDAPLAEDASPKVNSVVMSGALKAEMVQPGLLMSGYDLTYLSESDFSVKMERSVFCAVLLGGRQEPLAVEGYPLVEHGLQRTQVLGFGEPAMCRRATRRGGKARAFGITVQPGFLDRYGEDVDDDGLTPLREFLKPGFHRASLPWSAKIIEIGNAVLENTYSGALGRLFHESHSLRFLLEVAILLRERERGHSAIGRIEFERASEAREILDRSLVQPPKALDLARQVGVNLTTLQANFKAAFGTTIFRDDHLRLCAPPAAGDKPPAHPRTRPARRRRRPARRVLQPRRLHRGLSQAFRPPADRRREAVGMSLRGRSPPIRNGFP